MNAKEQPKCENSMISVDSNVVYFGVIYQGTRVLRTFPRLAFLAKFRDFSAFPEFILNFRISRINI